MKIYLKMDLRQLYFVLICAMFIQSFESKPFSINEALAAQSKRHQKEIERGDTIEPSNTDTSTEKYYKQLKSNKLKRKKYNDQDTESSGTAINTLITTKKSKFKTKLDKTPRDKLTQLKYRKAFQITSPIKPKKLRHLLTPLYRRRHQYLKRHSDLIEDGDDNQKYIPLIRSLSVLFDNILAGRGDTYESTNEIPDSEGYYSNRKDVVCKCALKPDIEDAESKQAEKTIATTKPPAIEDTVTSEAPETTTTTTYPTTPSNISRLRKNTILPVLLSRNTFSARRNNNGLHARSSSALHRSIERDIPRHNGNHEHNTEDGTDRPNTASNEENTRDATRDRQSGNKYRRRVRGNRHLAGNTVRLRVDGTTTEFPATEETTVSEIENEKVANRGGNIESQRQNQLEVRKHKTESQIPVPEPIRGIRRFISKDKISNDIESISSKKPDKESDKSVPFDRPSHKRVTDGRSSFTRQTENDGQVHETLVSANDLKNSTVMLQENPNKKKNGMVVIFDGYSIARDKNGENKLSKKTIHFHP